MLKYKPKPYTENQLQYYSYINYNFVSDYQAEEDRLLSSIDADLPTGKTLLEQRKKYNEFSKVIDRKIKKESAQNVLVPSPHSSKKISVLEEQGDVFVMDKDGSIVKWDRDTYEHFRRKNKFIYVSKL